jgi:predicted ester cyclase
MNAEANKALVQRYLEMWNTGSAAIADEILALDWHDHNHPEITSIDGVKQALLATRRAFPDFHITVEAIIGERNVVALRAIITRTQEGQTTSSKVVWFVRVENGKMAELWTVSEAAR